MKQNLKKKYYDIQYYSDFQNPSFKGGMQSEGNLFGDQEMPASCECCCQIIISHPIAIKIEIF